MRSASCAARSCSGALLLLSVLALAGVVPGSGPDPEPTAAPTVTATVPPADAVDVDPNGTIQVAFSEPMNATTVLLEIQPVSALSTSWPAPNVLNATPDPPGLAACTVYTLRVTGNDADEGLPLAPYAWSFMTACADPYIVETVPADGAVNVPPNADVVVTFSEAVDCLSIRILFSPNLTGPGTSTTSCNPPWIVTLRLTFGTAFRLGEWYTATVTARDLDGNNLTASLTPNPWRFRINAPPRVTRPTLSGSGCVDSGTLLTVSWTMADEDPAANLSVRLLFLNTSGWETFHGPARGFPSSASYGWVLPPADVTTRVRVEVTDSVGASAWNDSEEFRIDRGPPEIVDTTPDDGATDVPRDAAITIVFSEPMNRTSVENAVTTTPPLPGRTFNWISDQAFQILPGGMPGNTGITIAIGPTATDTCTPGRSLVPGPAANPFSFTTAKAPSNPPGFLRALRYDETSMVLEWGGVSRYVTGEPIPSGVPIVYRLFRDNGTGVGFLVGDFAENTTTDRGLRAGTTYTYWVVAIVDGVPSGPSATLTVRTLDPFLARTEGRISVLVALAAVGVAGVAGMWMRQRRKRAEAQAALAAEIREMVEAVRRARAEPNPEDRIKAEEVLQAHFRGLVKGETDEADPRLDGLYRALAAALLHSPEIDLSRGRAIVDERLGDLAPRFREVGASYRLLSEAEASVQSELFRNLPPAARKALLLVYFYALEEYLSTRLRGLIPAGATVLLGERGHINVRKRGWEAQWAGLTLGNLVFVLDHNTHFFVADLERWAREVEPLLKEAVDARNRTAHPSKEAPPLDRVRDLVYRAIPAVESILKWPTGRPAA